MDPRQLRTSLSATYELLPRYERPAMPPLAAHPPVHASTTGISALALGRLNCVPYVSMMLVPKPASSSTLLVNGELHVACCTVGIAWLLPRASGAVVALPPPMHDVHSHCWSS